MGPISQSFREFYKEYLGEHRNHLNRLFHHIGTLLGTLLVCIAIVTGQLYFVFYGMLIGYGMAWCGHYFVEKNKPMSLKRPFYSLLADYMMLYDLFTFNLDKKIQELDK